MFRIFHFVVLALAVPISGCTSWNTIPGGTFNRLDKNSLEFINAKLGHGLDALSPQKIRPNQRLSEVDFLIATSGGGQRAAAFTMGVLYELERLNEYSGIPDKLDARSEIDYFSSVSGGGWATGAYITAQLEHQKSSDKPYSLNRKQLKIIEDRLQTLEMSFFSNCLVEKLESNVTSIGGVAVTYSDIFSQPGSIPTVPYVFNNATIHSSHAPFVFSQPYMSHYSIEGFNYCGEFKQTRVDVGETPISIGIATSSSVPGFRFTQAKSSVCSTNQNIRYSWLCSSNPEYIHLYDGGVFDNLGYKTGLEVLSESTVDKKVMLVVDANADTYQPLEASNRSSEWKMLLGAGVMSTLAANAVTAQRSMNELSNSHGVETLVLGFYSAAGYLAKAEAVKELTGKDPLEGLCNLKEFVEIDSKGSQLLCDYLNSDNTDCENNKFYRIGLSSKTSHKIDDSYYRAVQDLGRLVVRLNAKEIQSLLTE